MKNEESTLNKKNIVESVTKDIHDYRLISYGDCVVLGVSGGPDSMALLHVMMSLRIDLGLKIIVAHFNHRIRQEAKDDERFVRNYAEQMGLQVLCQSAKSRPPTSGSLEDWARKERYKFFRKVCQRVRADALVLGHTADDLAETVLMRILRGSGLKGLAGMQAKKIIEDVVVVRPFLFVRKHEIYKYLDIKKIPYCVDQTNFKPDFFRNKIRLELLPLLSKEYNANITQVLIKLSMTSQEDYAFLEEYSSSVWKRDVHVGPKSVCLDIKKVNTWHPAIRRIIIRMAFEYIKGDLNQMTFDHVLAVENLIVGTQRCVKLPSGILVKRGNSHVCFSKGRN